MNRLRANCGEGKRLRDLEELNNFHCMINEATRITAHSKSFLDVILTNHPDLFKECGTYEPEISDHRLIHGELKEKVQKHNTETTIFRQTHNTDLEKLNQYMSEALGTVETFSATLTISMIIGRDLSRTLFMIIRLLEEKE